MHTEGILATQVTVNPRAPDQQGDIAIVAPTDETPGRRVVAEVFHRVGENKYEPAEANAARFVAAWNACAGIPTEALEAGVIAGLMGAIISLKRGDCWCEHGTGNPMLNDHTYTCKAVQSLLAKVKGE